MTATIKINLDTPQAVSLVSYIETLPFAEVKKRVSRKQTTIERIPGLAYTREELRQRAIKAEADIAAGLFIRHEDIPRKVL